MENEQTDTDASGQFVTGSGPAEQNPPRILDLRPNWAVDGHGVRGPQRATQSERVAPHPMEFGVDNSRKSSQDRSSGGGITVQTGPFSGGYTGTVNNVTTITLDENLFLIQDNGGGEVLIGLNTTDCS